MVDVLLIEGVSSIGVVRRLKLIGISLSMFSKKMPLIESLLSHKLIRSSDTEILFE